MKITAFLLAAFAPAAPLLAATLEPKPPGEAFARFEPVKAPAPGPLLFRKGDRLAICGDSITAQHQYSRLIEDYVTVCLPDLEIQARQYGWSGETAEGFLKRMKNDCLRFQPTVATICYGMNDHRYRPYEEAIGSWYRERMTSVVEAFQESGARVIVGSPGCVGKMPAWVKSATGTVDDLNGSLCTLRNLDVEIAAAKQARFADIFWPMLTQREAAHAKYGPTYEVAGKDGVHPGWAGHTVMAYAFLKASGVTGEIGTIAMDLRSGKATATAGHEVTAQKPGEVTLTSQRYPICASGAADQDGSIRSGMELVPFNQELNRLVLKITGGTAKQYKVTWGTASRSYPAAELQAGVNLAADFAENPFSAAFKKVDDAVKAKEDFEQQEVQKDFHRPEAKDGMEAILARDEPKHEELAKAVAAAVVPVTHTVTVVAE